jgi:hypothetical protein
LSAQAGNVAAGGECDHLEAAGEVADHVEGLLSDGPGGSEDR